MLLQREFHAELYGEVHALMYDKDQQTQVLCEKALKCERLYGRRNMRQKRELIDDHSLLQHMRRT